MSVLQSNLCYTELTINLFKSIKLKSQKNIIAHKKVNQKIPKSSQNLTLLTAYFYMVIYCNAKILHILAVSTDLKQFILSYSANALKFLENSPDSMQSVNCQQYPCNIPLQEQTIYLQT